MAGEDPGPNWRVRGAVLVVLGLFLVLAMAAIAWKTAPLMLRPGVEMAGITFNGTKEQGWLILALFAVVGLFGALCVGNGLHMLNAGVPNWRFSRLAYGIFLFLILFAFGTRLGLV
jgi:hypothetical protein